MPMREPIGRRAHAALAALPVLLGVLTSREAHGQADGLDVALCGVGLPGELEVEMRLELLANGHRVRPGCEGAPWRVGIEDATLAEVWVWVQGPEERRRTRIPRALDAVDGRALGIAAAGLLAPALAAERAGSPESSGDEDALSPGGESAPPEGRASEDELAALSAAAATEEPDAGDESAGAEPAEEVLHSRRSFRPDVVLMLAATALSGFREPWSVGGSLGFGSHLRAAARIDAGLSVLGASGALSAAGWVGLTRVWGRDRSWLELGGALAVLLHAPLAEDEASVGVGLQVHAGWQRSLSDHVRSYLRVTARPGGYLRSERELTFEASLSAGLVLAP